MHDNEQLRRCWSNLLNRSPEFCKKIAPLFEANNWTYAEREGMVVPDAQRLEGLVYSLAWEAYKNAPDGVHSGRLCVRFWQDKRETWQGSITLEPESVSVSEEG